MKLDKLLNGEIERTCASRSVYDVGCAIPKFLMPESRNPA
jgi:hypothetical protein